MEDTEPYFEYWEGTLATVPADALLSRLHQEFVRFCIQLPCLVLGKEENLQTRNAHQMHPKLIKTGEGKQSPTSNLLAVHLPSASLPTSFALHVGWAKAGTLCAVTYFQLGRAWGIQGCWLSWDMCSNEGQLLQTGKEGNCVSVLCLAL